MSDNAVSDEMVSQFLAFTGGANPSEATSYLEMSGGCLETAVGLYMEHNQTAGGRGSSDPSAGRAGLSGDRGMGGNSNDGGGALGGPSLQHMLDPNDIRAPDATRTMRLMDDNEVGGSSFNVINAIMEEQLSRSAFASEPLLDARAVVNAAAAAGGGGVRSSSNNTGDDHGETENNSGDYKEDEYDGKDSDNEDNNDETTGDISRKGRRRENNNDSSSSNPNSRAAPARLSDMFAPPTHLMHKAGGFQGARAVAKDSRRWLLVNLQRDEEFSSHALNRDVWRDELVENLVREGFIFWQSMDVSPEGKTYAERYQVYVFPHVSIIDPRTGRLLWRREGWTQENPVTASSFAEMAMDFCSRNSFERPPSAPRPPNGSNAVSSHIPSKRPMHEMSEDEQLQAAMKASLGESMTEERSASAAHHDTVDTKMETDDKEVEILDTKKPPSSSTPPITPKENKPTTFMDELISLDIGEEPSNGARIQFRLPGGKRIIRKFCATNSVKHVYAFISQTSQENQSEFTLMAGFPPNDLVNQIDSTIESCKLSGETVTVRWK